MGTGIGGAMGVPVDVGTAVGGGAGVAVGAGVGAGGCDEGSALSQKSPEQAQASSPRARLVIKRLVVR